MTRTTQYQCRAEKHPASSSASVLAAGHVNQRVIREHGIDHILGQREAGHTGTQQRPRWRVRSSRFELTPRKVQPTACD